MLVYYSLYISYVDSSGMSFASIQYYNDLIKFADSTFLTVEMLIISVMDCYRFYKIIICYTEFFTSFWVETVQYIISELKYLISDEVYFMPCVKKNCHMRWHM